MPWIAAAAGIGGDLIGGALGADAAGDAADAYRRSQREAQGFNNANYLTQLGINEPWRQGGQAALNQLLGFFGMPTTQYQSATDMARGNFANAQSSQNRFGAKAVLKMMKQGMSIDDIAKTGVLRNGMGNKLGKHGVSAEDISKLQAGPQFGGTQVAPGGLQGGAPTQGAFPPGYNFFREEGQRDLGNSFAARGGAFSGNALRGLSQFNQEYAGRNMIDPLFRLAGFGPSANASSGNAVAKYGANQMNSINNMGDARASGIANQGNIWGNAIGSAAKGFGDWWQNRNNGQSGPGGNHSQGYAGRGY